MAKSPRDLEWNDRDVWNLQEIVAARFADFDNLTDRFIFPDLTTQVNFVLSLNQTEWTQLYTAVLTGADLSYPNEAHNVELLFLQMMDVNMADLCAVIADCITNSDGTRTALNQFLEDMGYGSGGGDGHTHSIYDNNELLIDGSQVGGCSNDHLFGAITQSIDLFNSMLMDAYERFEAATAPFERLSAVLEAIPMTNVLAIDDLIQFADQMLENLSQNYEAEYTVAIRDEYRCDLFCLTKDTCEMSFKTMADYFMGRVGESFEDLDFQDALEWFRLGSFPDDAVVHASHAIMAQVLAYGSRFFSVDMAWLSKAMTSFLNDPDNDWDGLCDCGAPAGWFWVNVDWTWETTLHGGEQLSPTFEQTNPSNGTLYAVVFEHQVIAGGEGSAWGGVDDSGEADNLVAAPTGNQSTGWMLWEHPVLGVWEGRDAVSWPIGAARAANYVAAKYAPDETWTIKFHDRVAQGKTRQSRLDNMKLLYKDFP